jgi:hypothetical protein
MIPEFKCNKIAGKGGKSLSKVELVLRGAASRNMVQWYTTPSLCEAIHCLLLDSGNLSSLLPLSKHSWKGKEGVKGYFHFCLLIYLSLLTILGHCMEIGPEILLLRGKYAAPWYGY